MVSSLSSFIEWVELETFFSGYILAYAIIYLIAFNRQVSKFVRCKLLPKLPVAYACVGGLYFALQLKIVYPEFNINYFIEDSQFGYLKIWAILSLLILIPVLNKKAIYSLLHSLVFFFIMIKSFYLHPSSSFSGEEAINNNIKIYSFSVLINLAALLFVTLALSLITGFKKRNRATHLAND